MILQNITLLMKLFFVPLYLSNFAGFFSIFKNETKDQFLKIDFMIENN